MHCLERKTNFFSQNAWSETILYTFVFIASIAQPCRVARKVMEKSPHSLLVGDGAEAFAKELGFTSEANDNMLSHHTATAYRVFTHTVTYYFNA